MKKTIGIVLLAACFVPAGIAAAGNGKAELRDAGGKRIGVLLITPVKEGVSLKGKLTGLPPGKHGFHIHEKGICDAPAFKGAGAHFNPHGKKHGAHNPEGKHAGDLPNLEVRGDGTVEVSVIAGGVALTGGSLFREGGTSVVVHAAPDDEKTDPSGNSGDRIACGIIVSGD